MDPDELHVRPVTQPPLVPDHTKALSPLVHFIWSEWRVLKSPSFYVALALVTVAVYWLEDRHFSGTISEKDATIAALTTQLSGANRDNDKLGKLVEDLKTYRGKDAPPLKKTVLILAAQIHEFISKCKDWKGNAQNDYQYARRYEERFGRRVVFVRDDLDQTGQHSDTLDQLLRQWDYGNKVGLTQAGSIADELEKMANDLPD